MVYIGKIINRIKIYFETEPSTDGVPLTDRTDGMAQGGGAGALLDIPMNEHFRYFSEANWNRGF